MLSDVSNDMNLPESTYFFYYYIHANIKRNLYAMYILYLIFNICQLVNCKPSKGPLVVKITFYISIKETFMYITPTIPIFPCLGSAANCAFMNSGVRLSEAICILLHFSKAVFKLPPDPFLFLWGLEQIRQESHLIRR